MIWSFQDGHANFFHRAQYWPRTFKPQFGIILIIDFYFTIFTNFPHSPLCILVGKCPTIEKFPTNLFWWDGNELGLGLVKWCRWML
jgi:hypothetical protein